MLEYRVSLYPNFTMNLTLKLPHLKSDLGNEFFGSGLPCEVIFITKSWQLAKNGEMLEYRLSLYPNFTLNLTLKSPHLESDLGNEFFEPGLPCEVIFMPKIWMPAENLNLLQTRLSLKTRLGPYLGLTMTQKKNFKIFFQKIKPTPLLVQHVKRQPGSSTYVREKGCPTFNSNRGTPCSLIKNYFAKATVMMRNSSK